VTVVSPYEVRRARGKQEYADLLDLRYEVFCVEQGVPRHEEVDGRDGGGVHLVAVRDEVVFGTCRLVFVGTTVQFSRLAVRKSARRQGIATTLLEEADAHRLVLHAQTYARELYEHAGYRARGRPFVEAGIEHVAMEKTLA